MLQKTTVCDAQRRLGQTGGAVLAVVVSLLVVAAATLAIRMASQIGQKTDQHQLTQARLQRIQGALHAHAASHGRLPCPANGAADTGLADPSVAAVTCGSPDGTVPWVSLGLAAEEALDAWGRKISYRVYDGAAGLTQTDGADMTACDTVEPAPAVPAGPAFLCTAAHDVPPAAFLDPARRPGLTVRVAGTPQTQMAWVLVSHGVSGMGGWLTGGARMALPASADEQANTQPPPAVYVQREENTIDLDPATAAAHFDDLLRFETISQLIQAAGREARDWPDGGGPVTGDVIKKLLEDPNAIDTKGNGSGLTAIDLVTPDLGTVRISSTGGEISTDGPYKALGVCSSGCGVGNNSNRALDSSESLSFRLGTGKTAQSFALGLLGISGTTTVAVSVTFRRNGVVVGSFTQSAPINNTMPTTPQLANLAPPTPPGTLFDEVIVQPVGSSRFYVANVLFCQTSTCP